MKVHCNKHNCKFNEIAYCSKEIINIDLDKKCMEYKRKWLNL
jgi:hypothetical protein